MHHPLELHHIYLFTKVAFAAPNVKPLQPQALAGGAAGAGKTMLSKGKGIGFLGPITGALMAWLFWPYIKEFAYGLGLAQPIVAGQQYLSGKPVDWGTLRDPAVEHYFNTQYRVINPQF